MISSEFLQSILNGDEDAIQSLIRTNQRQIFQLSLSILDTSAGSPADAAEQAEIATRETFIEAIDKIGRYREETPFMTWLYSIAIQVSRKRARRWQFEQRVGKLFAPFNGMTEWEKHAHPEAAASEHPHEVGALAANEKPSAGAASAASASAAPVGSPAVFGIGNAASSDEALWNAVRRLDERLRLPVVLRYYHDFNTADIARLLKISEGAVHARLDQAREKLSAA